MQYAELLFGFAVLVGMFGAQVGVVKRLTAFIKEILKEKYGERLKAYHVRLVSFGVGAAIGALFYWAWIVVTPGLHVSWYVLTAVLFLAVTGMTASGDYDIQKETKAVENGVLGDRKPWQ